MKTSRLTRREIRRGASDQRKRSHEAARTYHEPCCWSEPDYNKVWSRTVSPRVSKSHLRRVSSSCPSEGAWDKEAVRRNPIMQGVEASGMSPYASIGFSRLACPFIFDAFQIFFKRVWQSARLFDYEGFCFRQ